MTWSPELDVPLDEFLTRLFAESQEVPFLVLRNAEQLPNSLTGTDLDVSTLPGVTVTEASEYVTQIGAACGWFVLLSTVRPHVAVLSLLSQGRQTQGIHFDIFKGITYLGIPLLTPKNLAAERQLRNGIPALSPRAEVLATVVHHWCWSGAVGKEKYRAALDQTLTDGDDGEWLRRHLAHALGRSSASLLLQVRKSGRLRERTLSRRLLITLLVVAAHVSRKPLRTLGSMARYLASQVPSFLSPHGFVMRPGDRLPGLPSIALSLDVACQISAHAFYAPRVRAGKHRIATENGTHYEAALQRMWNSFALMRWMTPSLFLWLNAKRGRIVMLDTAPALLCVLARSKLRPGWLSVSLGQRGSN